MLIGLLLMSVVSAKTAHAIDIQEIETKSGIKALLVEDYTLPIIAMAFSFEGGATQDEAGKYGTLRMMTALMDEGAGDLDNVAFQSRLEELAIDIGFGASLDRFSGSMRTVRTELASAKELLRLAINEPRFDADAIERMRDAIRNGLVRGEKDPGFQARKAFRNTLFEDHPYNRNVSGTVESIDAITRDDIVAIRNKILARDTLTIGVVGAINQEELSTLLDEVFGALPQKSGITEVPDIQPELGETVVVEMPTPNASIQVIYPGIKRSDPNFFAAHLMNYILGGAAFSSRLHDEVREKRGLAYSIYSGISVFENTEFLVAGTSTRVEVSDEVIALIEQEVKRMAEEGLTAEELEKAKKFTAGSYAISNLDTSGKIARVLVALQSENLGIDYINTREAEIEAVTLEDANRAAKQLLSVKPTKIIVRPPLTQ